ncbi:glycosyltransferase family 2 protein [archaeon]|nr:glycosyltransferase family 2 protein [archaeon]
MKTLTILIPCYNEEEGLPFVMRGIPFKKLDRLGFKTRVVVIDNNSKDRTAKVAEKFGAKVLFEPKQGKGNALIRGFKHAKDSDTVIMLDGDGSYKSEEMLRLIEPIDNGFCDVVIGSRLSGRITKNSMRLFNRFGNWLFTFLVRIGYNGNVTDVCTGYFAFKGKVIRQLVRHLKSDGFSIEMEMITKMARMGYEIFSVPITYEERNGRSNLDPVKDGIRIMQAFIKNLFWKP